MPHDKSKSTGAKDEKARRTHTAREPGPGTKVTGDAEKGKEPVDKALKEWKKDVDETPFPDKR
jgi:hypothetical protein